MKKEGSTFFIKERKHNFPVGLFPTYLYSVSQDLTGKCLEYLFAS